MSGEERREAREVVVEVSPSEGEGSRGGSLSDVEELKHVLSAVSQFLRDISKPLQDMLNTVLSTLDGGKLGDDVAAFYKRLKEAGLPDELVAEMTRQYFRERLKAGNVMELISRFIRKEILEEGEGEASSS